MAKERFWNIPNAITTIRLISTFLIIYFILKDTNFIITGTLFIIFSLTDALDGRLARRFNQTTKVGAKLDQIADRIFFSGITIALAAKYLIGKETFSSLFIYTTFPSWYLLLIISREIIALPAFLYLLASNKEFVKVRLIGKICTVLQVIVISEVILKMPFMIYFISILGFFGIVTGLTYWYDVAKARAVKYIKKKIKEKKEKYEEK